jgi:hypothetical protein
MKETYVNLVQMIASQLPFQNVLLAQRAACIDRDGNVILEYHGQVNECQYGSQCENHACYCEHPKGPRKCHRVGWGKLHKESYDHKKSTYAYEGPCQHFIRNPHWAGSMEATYQELLKLNLAGELKNED